MALTSACAPLVAREGIETRMPAIEKVEQMGISGDRYITRDGLKLGLMSWEAEMPKAIIVALHGMNDYSNAFARNQRRAGTRQTEERDNQGTDSAACTRLRR